MSRNVLGSTLKAVAEASAEQPFDAVVVGAGSAGLTSAATLHERGLRVAVVEAGPASFLTHISNTELRFASDLVRAAQGTVQYTPARLEPEGAFRDSFSCVGGRGLFWNGSAPRFQPHDFTGWPVGLEDLEPHYQWAEQAFRITHQLGETALAQRVIQQLKDAGFPAKAGPFAVDLEDLGDGHLSAGIASAIAPFLRMAGAALAEGALKLCTDSLVSRVLLNGDRVLGVAASSGGEEYEVRGRAVVLAGGGIESIRLAANSGVPDPHGRIGIGLQDHVFYRCYFDGAHLYTPDQRESATVHIPSSSLYAEQWEIQMPGPLLWGMDQGFDWAPRNEPGYRLMIRAFVATEKRDHNRLISSHGPLGAATATLHYSKQDEAARERVKGEALRIGEALGLTLVEDRLTGPGNSYHEAGGLDMGDAPAASVTDAVGCFHTIPSLVCTDAAAFPQIGATNPHLTIVAESRRKSLALADKLTRK